MQKGLLEIEKSLEKLAIRSKISPVFCALHARRALNAHVRFDKGPDVCLKFQNLCLEMFMLGG